MKLATHLLGSIAVASALGFAAPVIAAPGNSAPAPATKHPSQAHSTEAPAATTSGPKVDAVSVTKGSSAAELRPSAGPQLTSASGVHSDPLPGARPTPAANGHVYQVIPPTRPVSGSPNTPPTASPIQSDPLPGRTNQPLVFPQPVATATGTPTPVSGRVYQVIPPTRPVSESPNTPPTAAPIQSDPLPGRTNQPLVFPRPVATAKGTPPTPVSGRVYQVIPPTTPVSGSPNTPPTAAPIQSDPLPGRDNEL